MKLSLISAFLIFLVPAAWADNNGGLQKGEAPPRLTRWIADIAEPMTRVL
jgi:hypothetical protein